MAELDDYASRAQAVAEIYARNFDVTQDGLFFLGKMMEELGEVSAAYLKLSGRSRGADGAADQLCGDLEDEMADLFGFLLVFARAQGVDLGAAFDKKWGKYLEPATESA